jgi:2-polyprenyl-6-methoxyphenol hydroxylase-like FAD-dependent oxidoreductase
VNDVDTVYYSGVYLYGADGANSKVRDIVDR